ncbi:hypothetical protein C8R44DRAFT_399494 [Mycena epipterygia]|nr:hypothetical protein C8R44DRAFT_399494 [Mycena epipterygia]
MAHVDIALQNQKLFNVFKARVSTQKQYKSAAAKLGSWLTSEKAYYPEARKEIVDILLKAQETLRTSAELSEHPQFHVSLCSDHPLVDAYTQLILSMAPFQNRFEEPDLQASVQKLLATVAPSQNPTTTAPQIPPPDPVHVTPLPIAPSQQMRPSSSSLASALTPPVSNTSQVAVTPITSHPQETLNSPSVPDTQPRSNVTETTPAVGTGSASGPVASSSKPKRKKKKKDDLSKIIQADVQLHKQKRATIPKPVEVAPIATTPLNAPGVSDPSSGAVSTTVDSAVSVSSVAPVPSENARPPTPLVVDDVPIRAESDVKEPGSAPPEEPSSHDADVAMEHSGDVEMVDAHPQDALHASNAQAPNIPVSVPSAMDDEINRVFRTLTGTGASVEMTGPTASNPADATPDVAISVDMPPPPHVVELASVPDATEDPLQPIPEVVNHSDITSMEGIVDTPASVPPQADLDHTDAMPGNLVANPPVDNPAAFQAIIQTMVNNVNKLIALEELPTPPASGEISSQHERVEFPQLATSSLSNFSVSHIAEQSYLGDITPSTKTGIETATVIARHRGLPSGTINIEFAIGQDQLDSITKWNDRANHSENIEESLCITLLCFSSADLKAPLESSESKDLQTHLRDLECGLSMNALWNAQRIDLPMAPPFALPSNGLVDVSPFLVLGQNTFRITQTRDMSKYWLILCAHHPTLSQLNAVARRRHKDREWTGWLVKLSSPLQLPFRTPIEV